jgi:hypothetical protein
VESIATPLAKSSPDPPRYEDQASVVGAGADERVFTLRTTVTTSLPITRSPVVSLRDFALGLTVDYATPVPTVDWTGVTTTSSEFAPLVACPETDPRVRRGALIEESHAAGGVSIETAYYHPVPPGGIVAGYTAPLYAWVETTITGLTTEPLVLTGAFSQTYRPEHHNFASNFIFDPWLDPAVTAAQRAELATADVRWLAISGDGTIRRLTLGGVLLPL